MALGKEPGDPLNPGAEGGGCSMEAGDSLNPDAEGGGRGSTLL